MQSPETTQTQEARSSDLSLFLLTMGTLLVWLPRLGSLWLPFAAPGAGRSWALWGVVCALQVLAGGSGSILPILMLMVQPPSTGSSFNSRIFPACICCRGFQPICCSPSPALSPSALPGIYRSA